MSKRHSFFIAYLTEKEISFQVNWVDTQAFLTNWVLAFSIVYHFFDT